MPGRFYIDRNVPYDLTGLLNSAGYDAVHCRDLYLDDPGDDYHLLAATRQDRALITHNRGDFELLHDAWHRWLPAIGHPTPHAALVILPQLPAPSCFTLLEQFVTTHRWPVDELYVYSSTHGWVRRRVPSP